MKFALFVVALVALLWLVRRSIQRHVRGPAARSREPAQGLPQPMLECAECGMHLPRDEALPGRGGVFCGEAHRAAYERAHPGE